MFRFAHPVYLLLLLPLAAAAWRVFRLRRSRGLAFTGLAVLPAPPRTWRTAALLACPALALAGMALCIVALARPQSVSSRARRTTEAIAICMAVDVSGSMQALDFGPEDNPKSRLDVVKETFADFVARRPDDLVALVAFAGYANSLAPLTLDHAALLHVLSGVQIPRSIIGADGAVSNQEELLTSIGDALATACARLKDAEVKSKIVVLLSDGDSNFGIVRPMDAARAAAALGIRVYTIGIGSTGSAPFPWRDALGRTFIRHVIVTMDEQLLKAIAETTGGQYFDCRNPRALRRALEEIDTLEKTEIDTLVYEQYKEWFARWLIPGLLLTAIGALGQAAASRRVI